MSPRTPLILGGICLLLAACSDEHSSDGEKPAIDQLGRGTALAPDRSLDEAGIMELQRMTPPLGVPPMK
ncbi:MAG: hypothetical protein IPM23_04355 [Candidatus Melainabacteria bacterium]|nr:hypothetical protein [Candidatus Melainabacteria bacterium]